MQVTDSILQAVELLHFFVAQHAVEYGKIIHVSDVRRAQHQQNLRRIPAEGQIPILNHSLQLAVHVQTTGLWFGFVVDVLQGENHVRPRLARERRTLHLNHRAFVERDIRPSNVVRVPDLEQWANGITEVTRCFVL